MTFTKKEMLQMLDKIKQEHNININKYIDEVIELDIPVNALKFINLYIPLQGLGVFNLIYSKRRKTPLFHNFKKGDIDNFEQVVSLGSLLTQMLCYVKTTKDDVTKHNKVLGANSILEALDEFINTGQFDKVNKTYNDFSNIFNELYSKEGNE